MHRDYLGDSYDAVKRMWQQIFEEWAPLYADPQFVPVDLWEDFTRMTRIPVMTEDLPSRFSLFNDPHTGIRLPRQTNQKEGLSHVTIETILRQLRIEGTQCVITFDQSHYRLSGFPIDKQHRVKMRELSKGGFFSFYYVSHAPFLFAFPSADLMEEARALLTHAGIPNGRFRDL